MATAIAITEDFVTKSGLIVQGTGTVTSSTGQTTALQVNGGAAIAKNLIVGTTANINGTLSVGTTATIGVDAIVNRNLIVSGNSRLVTVTATGVVSITNATAATTASIGALIITGGIYAGKNVVIASTTSNTGTTINNALYVAGGIGIGKSLVVDGETLFKGDVTFVGSSTFLYSVNSLYTDNIIELHVPPAPQTTWSVDDGRDIGLRFHYYNGADQNAGLVLAHDTKYLEWYDTGTEDGSGDFVSGTYGTFKTGVIQLVSGTASSNTYSGDLIVAGGVGVAGDIYVGNSVNSPLFVGNLTGVVTTATNLEGGSAGALPYQTSDGATTFLSISSDGYVLTIDSGLPTWAPIQTVVVDYANTATNLKYGDDMEIPYQLSPGVTEFNFNLRYDHVNSTLRTVNAVFTGTDDSSSVGSGALQVVGGVGIGGNIYVGSNASIVGNLEIDGGDITTLNTTINLINTTATTVNFAGEATAIIVGSTDGSTTIRNLTTISNTASAVSTVTGALQVVGGVGIQGAIYIGGTSTFLSDLLPENSRVNLGSLASPFKDLYLSGNSLYVGSITVSSNGSAMVVSSSAGPANLQAPFIAATTTTNAESTNTGALQAVGGAGIGRDLWVGGNETLLGDLEIRGGNLTTDQTTFNLLNTNATTVNFAGAGTVINIGSTSTGYTNINNRTTVTNTAVASSTVTGALVVAGGVGIGKSLWVGGNETLLGDLEIRGGDLTTDQTTFNLINAVSTTVNFAGAGTAITIGSTNGTTIIRNRTTVSNRSAASSTVTGALVVGGGVGIGGALYVGAASYIDSSIIITEATLGLYGVSSLTAGTDTQVSTSTGPVVIWNNSTLQTITDRDNSTTNIISITNTTDSTGTSNGALTVSGGVGISKTLYVNTVTVVSRTASISTNTGALVVAGGVGIAGNIYLGGIMYGIANTATNVAGGAAGKIPFQISTGTTGFFGPGTNGQILISKGTTSSGHLFVDTSTFLIGYSVNVAGGTSGSLLYQSSANTTNFIGIGADDTFLRSDGSTATFVTTSSMFVGRASLTNNVAGGVSGSLLYQSNPDTTTSLPIGTNGQILQSDGSNPAWVDFPGGVVIPNAANVGINNDTSNADTNYITFVNTSTGQTGIRVSSPSGITYVPSTGNMGIGVSTATTKLEVGGGVRISGATTITNTTVASSTTTGALQVAGGVGIGGTAYIGGNINVVGTGTFSGDIVINGGDITTNQPTFNLINAVSTSVNFAGAGTAISIGSSSGITTIKNNLTVVGNITVQGKTTIVDSTVTNFADPVITLGGLANDDPLTTNDNFDKGIAYKYYSGSAKLGFFGYTQGSGFLTFIPDATIVNNVVTSGAKGAIDINLAGGTLQSIPYQSNFNVTSFLAAGNAGELLQTNGTGSAPSWVPTAGLTAGNASTSTHLSGGNAAQIPFQTSIGRTSFISTGTAGQILVSAGTTSTGPVFTNTSSIRVGFATVANNIVSGSSGQVLFQSTGSTTGFAGPGSIGNLLVSNGPTSGGPTFQSTSTILVGYAVNVQGGTSGQLVFQSTGSTTSFAGPGTAGQILISAGTTSTGPVFTNTATFLVGYSVNAFNLTGGSTGSVVYQSATGTTAMLAPGAAGNILQTNGPGLAPSWLSVSGLTAGNATTSTNLAGGTAGQIPYQQSPGITSFISTSTAGNILVSNGTGAPTYNNTLTLAGTTAATNTTTGALQVKGGVGIGGSVYVGNRVGFVNASNVSTVYQYYNATTNSLDTVFG